MKFIGELTLVATSRNLSMYYCDADKTFNIEDESKSIIWSGESYLDARKILESDYALNGHDLEAQIKARMELIEVAKGKQYIKRLFRFLIAIIFLPFSIPVMTLTALLEFSSDEPDWEHWHDFHANASFGLHRLMFGERKK